MTITEKAAIKHVAREGERRFLIAHRNYLKNVPPDVVQAVKRRGLALPAAPAGPPAAAPVAKPIVPVAKPGVKAPEAKALAKRTKLLTEDEVHSLMSESLDKNQYTMYLQDEMSINIFCL